jgi:hypothetical protein
MQNCWACWPKAGSGPAIQPKLAAKLFLEKLE